MIAKPRKSFLLAMSGACALCWGLSEFTACFSCGMARIQFTPCLSKLRSSGAFWWDHLITVIYGATSATPVLTGDGLAEDSQERNGDNKRMQTLWIDDVQINFWVLSLLINAIVTPVMKKLKAKCRVSNIWLEGRKRSCSSFGLLQSIVL